MAVPILVIALLAAVLSIPYLLVHHFRGQRGGHLALPANRLRRPPELIDLAPHAIVADARKADLTDEPHPRPTRR